MSYYGGRQSAIDWECLPNGESSWEVEDTCMSYQEEDTCMSYDEEDTCMSYGEEDTYLAVLA